MRNPAYLAQSRHGIFYFRYPLSDGNAVRLSLRTRAPKLALQLAMALSVVASREVHSLAQGHIDIAQLRGRLARHFEYYKTLHREQAAKNGPRPEQELVTHDQFLDWHEEGRLGETWNAISFETYVSSNQVPVSKGSTEYEQLRADHAAASLAHRRFIVQHDRAMKLGPQTTELGPRLPPAAELKKTDAPETTLEEIAKQFVLVQLGSRTWDASTAKERQSHLGYLYELIPQSSKIGEVSAREARTVRDMLVKTPANRKKLVATKGLSLAQQITVEGVRKLDTRTIKKHLQTYKSLFDWAMKEGYLNENPFSKVTTPRGSARDASEGKQAFWGGPLRAILSDVLHNETGMVTQPHYKWATLLAIYTGARLNEICQLELSDIDTQGEFPCIKIDDEGDEKSVKTGASRRTVPLHSQVLASGFLQYADEIRATGATRLFPLLRFQEKSKWGRSVGSWFNDRYLPARGLKDKDHSFHSFRHTMVTMLSREGVEQPLIQAIVGHQRGGVTQGYNRAGLSLVQRRDAIELFDPMKVPESNPDR